ncbi:MAG: HipA N-terminal domain-containing protein, partial [Saprospiraceae bacterium]
LWFADQTKPPICLAFPKSMREYFSKTLFPFFFNMLPEGINKRLLCAQLRLDESDYFGILLNTAKYDTIGAVTLSKLPDTP